MKKILLSLSLLFSLTAGKAQTNGSSNSQVSATLQGHFNRLKSNANNYQEYKREYKVIEVTQLNRFWENVQETVQQHEKKLEKSGKNTETELEQAKATISAQTTQLAALQRENAKKTLVADQNAYDVSHISVLGLGIDKQVFLIMAAVLIGLLGAALAVVYSLYKKSKVITDQKMAACGEIEQEFFEFKKTSRDRELKIKRELQTEINRQEEMKQQLASLQKLTL